MHRTKSTVTAKSIRDDAIERAIRTTLEDFEGALTMEWNASADCATIRNAMRVQRNRCRKCGKPVAGIGDICDCKTKVDQERCVLNPRNTLRELFQQRCRGIAASKSLGEFVETVTSIALANDRDPKWVRDQIRSLLPSLKRTCRRWIIGICPLLFTQTDLLPAWLKDEREIIPDSDLQRSLSAEDTEAEQAKIEVEIKRHFEEASKTALDRASVQMVRAMPLHAKHAATRQSGPDLTGAMIARVKRDNPGVSIERVCQILDAKGCPLRAIDKLAGFSSWHGAWQGNYKTNCLSSIESTEAITLLGRNRGSTCDFVQPGCTIEFLSIPARNLGTTYTRHIDRSRLERYENAGRRVDQET